MPLKLEVVNVGPIRRAELTLRDLNILIGENNTGKTFFATIVHRVLASRDEAYFPGLSFEEEIPVAVSKHVSTILALVRQGDHESTPRLLATGHLRSWADAVNRDTLQRLGGAAREALSYAYSMPLKQLRRRQLDGVDDDSYIRITNGEPFWQIEVPIGDESDSEDISVVTPDAEHWLNDVFGSSGIEQNLGRFESRWSSDKDRDNSPEQRVVEFCQYVLYMRGDTSLFRSWPLRCVHLPSERGGIMQGYRAIASAALKKSAFAGIERIDIEPLDGTSRDFLSFVISPEGSIFSHRDAERFLGPASDIETKLRAEIVLVRDPNGPDRIVAQTPEGQFELNQTSSMISELAALVLALKHRLSVRDYLTIDEPEAHLHPEMQVAVAKHFVDLAEAGLGITLTTHSDYFVEQVSNSIRLNELATEYEESSLPEIPQIDRSQVSALWFSRSDDGCVAHNAIGDSVDPIDGQTFISTNRSQYEISAPLINRLLERMNSATETSYRD